KVYEKEISGGEAGTTNNRMELTGLLEALRQLKEPCDIDLYSDSQYVINSLTKWLPGWKRKGWKKADGKPVL
ncbi:MAG TPA: ribonuclease H, partial [Gemmiger qucibialis]|nr:ribonuclease H [Gemmiger qucibialis]